MHLIKRQIVVMGHLEAGAHPAKLTEDLLDAMHVSLRHIN